jgi:hypothetical protein
MRILLLSGVAVFVLLLCGCSEVPMADPDVASDAAPYGPDPTSHIPVPNERPGGGPINY